MEEERKVERKRKRFAARLKLSREINCSDSPTLNIVICNAGQATSLDKDTIYEVIKKTCNEVTLPKFIAEKGQSYSFLVFAQLEDAAKVFEKCHGRVYVEETLIYMSYVETVPETEITQNQHPPDLMILRDFITKEEEELFIKLFDWMESDESKQSQLKNRQVKHYGYEFRYGTNDVDLNRPLEEKIPTECDVLWQRLKDKGFDVGKPNQLTVNKYMPGQGIPSHVDKHSPFGATILSLSLSSAVVMDWRHHAGTALMVPVPPRSMMIIAGEARYDWQHGIQPRTWDPVIEYHTDPVTNLTTSKVTSDTVPRQTRISLTFRWTRKGPCECSYKALCDSVQRKDLGDVASQLEDLHVHQVYEQIAGHFSTTRHKPWPRVVQFLQTVAPGDIVLDLGAGNGKNVLPRGDILQIACERSQGLLSECKQHISSIGRADCVRLDLLQVCLRDRCADAVICIAVIHHFSSQIRRQQALASIFGLLRVGGRALITVWAKDQTQSNYLLKDKARDTKQEVISVGGVTLPVHENRTQFQHNDLLVPWKLRHKSNDKLTQPESTFLRYYHVFEQGELDQLCNLFSPNIEIEESFYEEGNWCVICKKINI